MARETDFYSTSPRPWPLPRRRSTSTGINRPDARNVEHPEIELRILGGWALHRGEGLRQAIDLAAEHRANRVLYNWWGWVPGDHLEKDDEQLVEYARERGVELICELRRFSLGSKRSITDPVGRQQIIDTFLAAADAGFRSFGLLFDDVAFEPAEVECELLHEIWQRLGDRTGRSPELYTCPRYYWFPGQMALDWKGAADEKETAVQRQYLATYGRLLPEEIHVYVANFWDDFPDDYAERVRTEYSELIGRKPVFFDNQLINDYRLGAIFPFALHRRPADFGDHFRGYLLNAPRPLCAHAPSVATALSFARNPRDYDPELALGDAIESYHVDPARVGAVLDASVELISLAVEWADGEFVATNHYRTLLRQMESGRAGLTEFTAWRRRLAGARESILDALRTTESASDGSTRGLVDLVASCTRLDSDLEIFQDFLTAHGRISGPDSRETALRELGPRFAGARQRALEQVAAVLPRRGGDAAKDGSTARLDESWAEYFYLNTQRELSDLEQSLRRSLGGTR